MFDHSLDFEMYIIRRQDALFEGIHPLLLSIHDLTNHKRID